MSEVLVLGVSLAALGIPKGLRIDNALPVSPLDAEKFVVKMACSGFCFIRKLLTVPRHFLLFLQPSFLKSEIAF